MIIYSVLVCVAFLLYDACSTLCSVLIVQVRSKCASLDLNLYTGLLCLLRLPKHTGSAVCCMYDAPNILQLHKTYYHSCCLLLIS